MKSYELMSEEEQEKLLQQDVACSNGWKTNHERWAEFTQPNV
jgi:hypothetical protein